MSPLELTPTVVTPVVTVPRNEFCTSATGSVKSLCAQPPPICAPRKQLVQLKIGTGATYPSGMSAASAGPAMLDEQGCGACEQ